ncbi:hypothetical protein [Rubritalea tangerina]
MFFIASQSLTDSFRTKHTTQCIQSPSTPPHESITNPYSTIQRWQ